MIQQLDLLDQRIPGWDLSELVNRECPVCKCDQNVTLFKRPCGLIVNRCEGCDLKFVSPAPSVKQIDNFYASYDKDHRPTNAAVLSKQELVWSFGDNPLSDLRIREISSYMSISESRFLDVGFGVPNFLYSLKRLGGEVFGIETDKTALGYAKNIGISNFFETFDDLPSIAEFDCIILNDVIEHPLNPFELLELCKSKLSKDGKIFLWTPNGDYISSVYPNLQFRVDLEHMQYFNVNSFVVLSSKLDMRILHMETLGFPLLGPLISKGSVRTVRFYRSIMLRIRKFLRSILLFKLVAFFRLSKNEIELRKGSYHLFVVLTKQK
jgi:2-polyprenyl-3-methyl-5-hydroxy-6-metoxy-1,4-benzoquinol methylase